VVTKIEKKFWDGELEKNFFNSLTTRLESFTAFIPIPTFIYYIYIIAKINGYTDLHRILFIGFFCGFLSILFGSLIRYFKIKTIFQELKRLKDPNISEKERIQFKLKLLNYPYIEAKIVTYRWLVGLLLGFLGNFLISGIVGNEVVLWGIFGFLFVLPISQVLFFFLTEEFMRRLLQLPQLLSINLPEEIVKNFNYFIRIAYSILSVALIPITILGFFVMYSIEVGEKFENPKLHLFILSFLSLISMGVVAYVVARSIRETIAQNNKILLELSQGNFKVLSSRTTLDELGLQGYLLGTVIQRLRNFVDEIQRFNFELEERVNQRTTELKESFDVILKLKEQQDADYYLTSMLLIPLSKNASKNEDFDIKFSILQNKKFTFYGKEYEIGGDLCRVDDLHLQGKEFILFLASDAMGKSIQGAGGALVLGAVYDSMIQRTKNERSMNMQPPELWLKNAFIELQRVFESFQGAMLVSIHIGLVDVKTGVLYSINADHPRSVLYKEGKAEFFEKNSDYYKLGSIIDHNFIYISLSKLDQGEIFITGSDGRDDILLPEDGKWQRNYEAEYFLKIVELARGNIDEIGTILQQKYKITDDISFISIQAKPQWVALGQYWRDKLPDHFRNFDNSSLEDLQKEKAYYFRELRPNPYKIQNLVLPFLRKRNFKEAVECGLYCLHDLVFDTELLYLLSYGLKKEGKFEEAAQFGERVRVREPLHIKNLFNLIQIYTSLEEYINARRVLKHYRFLQRDSEKDLNRWNERFKKLERKIESLEKFNKFPLTHKSLRK
jgi:hypothetical protein